MSLTLGALTFLYLVLPGLLLIRSYQGARQFTRKPETPAFESGLTTSAVVALVLAPILHAIWLPLILLITPEHIAHDIGHIRQGLTTVTDFVLDHFYWTLFYNISLYIVVILIGAMFRRVVINQSLDLKWASLRFPNEWYYLFQGDNLEEEPAGAMLTVTLESGGITYLYRGFLDRFWRSGDGELQKIALVPPVWRREIANDRESDEKDSVESGERYYKIDGEHFIVWGRDIQTLNIDYLFAEPWEDRSDIEYPLND